MKWSSVHELGYRGLVTPIKTKDSGEELEVRESLTVVADGTITSTVLNPLIRI